MKLKDSYHPYAITAIIGWAIAYVFSRLALKYYSPMELGFLRYFIASVIFLVIIVFQKTPLPKLKDLPYFLISAASGFSLYMFLFNNGTRITEATLVSVILAIVPILTAILAQIFYKEKMTLLQWVAVGIEFSGILVIALFRGNVTFSAGIYWLLGASVLFSIYNLMARKLTRTYNSFQTTAYTIILGTLMLGIFAPGAFKEVSHAPVNQLGNLLILGVFSSAIAYVAWATAFRKAPNTSVVSNYMFFTPLVTALFSFLFANEIPETITLIGGALVLAGVALFNREKQKSEKRITG